MANLKFRKEINNQTSKANFFSRNTNTCRKNKHSKKKSYFCFELFFYTPKSIEFDMYLYNVSTKQLNSISKKKVFLRKKKTVSTLGTVHLKSGATSFYRFLPRVSFKYIFSFFFLPCQSFSFVFTFYLFESKTFLLSSRPPVSFFFISNSLCNKG